MIALIDANRAEIGALCRKYGVARLDLFGSAANGRFDASRSDVDVLVEFLPRDSGQFDTYFDLRDALQRLFARPVDLVVMGAVRNTILRAEIDRTRRTLYAP